MNTQTLHILLADDDDDDCLLFEEALAEVPINTQLTTVRNGHQLMQFLYNTQVLPQVLFLDLNMPIKNGYECLKEIKEHADLAQLPVIVFSTSFDKLSINLLYDQGAHLYIRKPSTFSQLKEIIYEGLKVIENNNFIQPTKKKFVLPL